MPAIGRAVCQAAASRRHLRTSKQPHQLSYDSCFGDEETEAQRNCPGSRISGWKNVSTCPEVLGSSSCFRGTWGALPAPHLPNTGSPLGVPHQQPQGLSPDPLNRLPVGSEWQGRAPPCSAVDSGPEAWHSRDSRPATAPWGFSSSPEQYQWCENAGTTERALPGLGGVG